MNYSSLIKDIKADLPGVELREGESLSRHSSLRIGGPAALMALPGDSGELEALCALLAQKGEKPFLLGNGTNILFPDGGLERGVIHSARCAAVSAEGTEITAECGAGLARTATAALSAGLTGLEFAHGIPGSVGGGAVMNAGAYGGELGAVLTKTEYLDENLCRRTLRGTEHDFSYRHSFFSDQPGIILRCVFSLTPGDGEEISAKMRELSEKRRASQPLDMPSAGSAFKRPAEGYAAAMIDEAGLKGFSVGGAQVSEKHAGFIVNTGGATCADVLRLIEHIQKTVSSRFGVTLEPEIRVARG